MGVFSSSSSSRDCWTGPRTRVTCFRRGEVKRSDGGRGIVVFVAAIAAIQDAIQAFVSSASAFIQHSQAWRPVCLDDKEFVLDPVGRPGIAFAGGQFLKKRQARQGKQGFDQRI